MTKKIIFSSGGTGGHIFPAINLMKYFSNKGVEVILVTDNRGENFLKGQEKFNSYIINSDTPTNKSIIKKALSFAGIFIAIIKSIFILRKEKPNLVFGLGGYVSFPVSFASKFLNIPLVIYENNLILGRANKILLRFSNKIFLNAEKIKNFPEKYKKKICTVGSILSNNIINYSITNKKNMNKNFTILVLGGSQGAEIFGKIIPLTIKMLENKGHKVEIYQQCIKSQKDSIIDFYKQNNIKHMVFEFTPNILDFISVSDIAISRCGASTIAELKHTLTPFIAVPLHNSIDDHQYLNAKYYEEMGCCWLMEHKNFSSKNLFNLILKIIEDKKELKNIKENMKRNQNKNVYSNIENAIKEFIDR